MLKNDNPLNKDVLNKEVIPLFDPIDWQLHVESYKEILEKNQQRMNIDDPKFDLFKDSIKRHLVEMFQSQQNRSPKEAGVDEKKKFDDSLPTLVKEKFEELRSLYSNGLSKLTQKQDANKLITDVIDRDENVKMACMQSLSDIYESYMQPAFLNKLIEIIGGAEFMNANSTIFEQTSKMSPEKTQKIVEILNNNVQTSPVSKEYIGLLQDFFILYIKGSGALYLLFTENDHKEFVTDALGKKDLITLSESPCVPIGPEPEYKVGDAVKVKDAGNNIHDAIIEAIIDDNNYTIRVGEQHVSISPKMIVNIGKLKETFDKLNLGNSDWDLNLCINPGFYALEDKTIFKKIYNFLLDWNRIQMYKCREKYFLKPGSQLLISDFFKQINYDYLIKKDESVKKENENKEGIMDRDGKIRIDQTDIGIAFKERKEVDSTIFRCVSDKDVDIYLHNKPSAMAIAEPEPIPMGEPEDPKKNIGKAYSVPWIGSDPLNEVEKLELDEIIEQNGNDYTKTYTFVKELFAETSSTSIKFAYDNLEQREKYIVVNEDDTVGGLLPPETYADGTQENKPSNEPRSIYIQYNDSIDAFGLLRMSMLGMNTINNSTNGGTAGAGELLDISYIKEYNEMVSDWTHRDLLINPERIPLLDYWDIIMDLNVTIRDNILEGKTKKIGKRIDRLTFLQSLLCCKENIQENIDALLQYYTKHKLVSDLDDDILIFSEGDDRRVKKFVLLLKKLQETDDKYIHFPYDESIEAYIQKTLKKTAPPEKIDEFLSQKIEEVKKIFNNKEIMQIRKTLKLNHKEKLKEDGVLNLIAKLHGFCKKQIEPNINNDSEKINTDDLKAIVNSPSAKTKDAKTKDARQKNVLKSYLIYLNRYKDGINNMIDQIFTNNDNTLNKQNFNTLIEMVVSGLDLVTGNFCGFTWILGVSTEYAKREYMQDEYIETEAPSAEAMQTEAPKQTYKIFTSLVLDYYINIYNQMSMLLAKIQINNDLGKNTSIYTDMSLFDDIFKNIATDAIMLELYLRSEIKPSFKFYPSIRYIFFTDQTNIHGLREMFDSVRTGEDFDVFMNDTKINELLNGDPNTDEESFLSTKTENNTKPFFEYFLCNNVGKDVDNGKGNFVPDRTLFSIVNNYDNYKYDHFYIFCKDFDKHYPYIKSFIPIFDTYVSPSELLTTKLSELKMGLPDDIERRNTFYTEMEKTFIKHFDQFPNEKLKRKIQDILKDIFRCIKEDKYQEVLDVPFLKVEEEEGEEEGEKREGEEEKREGEEEEEVDNMDLEIFDSSVNFNMDIDNIQELTIRQMDFDRYLGFDSSLLPFVKAVSEKYFVGGNVLDFLRYDAYPNVLLNSLEPGSVIELMLPENENEDVHVRINKTNYYILVHKQLTISDIKNYYFLGTASILLQEDTTLNTQITLPETPLTAQIQMPDTTFTEQIQMPETTLTAQITLPETTLTAQITLPETTLTAQIRLPETTLTAQIRLPETTLTAQIRLPETTLTTQIQGIITYTDTQTIEENINISYQLLIPANTFTDPNGNVNTEDIDLPVGTYLTAGTILPVGTKELVSFPAGTVLQEGMFLPTEMVLQEGTILPAGTVLQEGTILPAGTVLQEGAVFPAGTVLQEGTVLPAGTVLPEGTILEAGTILQGTILEAGTVLPAGTILEAGTIFRAGTILPALTGLQGEFQHGITLTDEEISIRFKGIENCYFFAELNGSVISQTNENVIVFMNDNFGYTEDGTKKMGLNEKGNLIISEAGKEFFDQEGDEMPVLKETHMEKLKNSFIKRIVGYPPNIEIYPHKFEYNPSNLENSEYSGKSIGFAGEKNFTVFIKALHYYFNDPIGMHNYYLSLSTRFPEEFAKQLVNGIDRIKILYYLYAQSLGDENSYVGFFQSELGEFFQNIQVSDIITDKKNAVNITTIFVNERLKVCEEIIKLMHRYLEKDDSFFMDWSEKIDTAYDKYIVNLHAYYREYNVILETGFNEINNNISSVKELYPNEKEHEILHLSAKKKLQTDLNEFKKFVEEKLKYKLSDLMSDDIEFIRLGLLSYINTIEVRIKSIDESPDVDIITFNEDKYITYIRRANYLPEIPDKEEYQGWLNYKYEVLIYTGYDANCIESIIRMSRWEKFSELLELISPPNNTENKLEYITSWKIKKMKFLNAYRSFFYPTVHKNFKEVCREISNVLINSEKITKEEIDQLKKSKIQEKINEYLRVKEAFKSRAVDLSKQKKIEKIEKRKMEYNKIAEYLKDYLIKTWKILLQSCNQIRQKYNIKIKKEDLRDSKDDFSYVESYEIPSFFVYKKYTLDLNGHQQYKHVIQTGNSNVVYTENMAHDIFEAKYGNFIFKMDEHQKFTYSYLNDDMEKFGYIDPYYYPNDMEQIEIGFNIFLKIYFAFLSHLVSRVIYEKKDKYFENAEKNIITNEIADYFNIYGTKTVNYMMETINDVGGVGSILNVNKEDQQTTPFEIGHEVEAVYSRNKKGQPQWLPCNIYNIRENGTYDIQFEDEEILNEVSKEEIRFPIADTGGIIQIDGLTIVFKDTPQVYDANFCNNYDSKGNISEKERSVKVLTEYERRSGYNFVAKETKPLGIIYIHIQEGSKLEGLLKSLVQEGDFDINFIKFEYFKSFIKTNNKYFLSNRCLRIGSSIGENQNYAKYSGGLKTRSKKPKRKGTRSKKPVKPVKAIKDLEAIEPVKPVKRGGGTILTTDAGKEIDLASYDFIGHILLKIVKSRFYMEYNNYLQNKENKLPTDSTTESKTQTDIIRGFSIPYGLLCTKGVNVQKITGDLIPTPPDIYNLGFTTKGPHYSFNQYMTSAIENENLYLNEDVNTANQQLMKAFYHMFYKKVMTDIQKRCTNAKIGQAKSNIIVSADPITILQNMNQQNGLPVFPVEITITGKGKYFKELMTCCITEYKNNIDTVKQMLFNGEDYHVALYNYIIFHVNKTAVANSDNDYLNANSILYKGRFYRQYGENLEYTSFDIHYETGPQSLKLNFIIRNHKEQHRIGTIVISTLNENLYKYSIPKTININSIGSPIQYDPELLFAGQTIKTQEHYKYGIYRFIDGIKDPNHYVIYKTLKAFDKYITNVKKQHPQKYQSIIDDIKKHDGEKLIEQLQLYIYEDKIYFFAQKILTEHFGAKDDPFFKPVTKEDIQTKMDAIAQGVLDAPFFHQGVTVYISSYNPIFEEFKEQKNNNAVFGLNLVMNSVHAKFKKIYDLYRSKNNIPDNQLNNVLQLTGKILEIPSTLVTPDIDIQLKPENLEGFNDVFQVSDDKYRYNPEYKHPTLISSGSNTFQKYGTNVFFENETIGNSSDYVTVCNIYDIMMRNGQASQNYGFATPGSNDRVITYSSDLNLGFNDVDIGNYAVELLQSDKKKIPVDNYDEYDPDDDYFVDDHLYNDYADDDNKGNSMGNSMGNSNLRFDENVSIKPPSKRRKVGGKPTRRKRLQKNKMSRRK